MSKIGSSILFFGCPPVPEPCGKSANELSFRPFCARQGIANMLVPQKISAKWCGKSLPCLRQVLPPVVGLVEPILFFFDSVPWASTLQLFWDACCASRLQHHGRWMGHYTEVVHVNGPQTKGLEEKRGSSISLSTQVASRGTIAVTSKQKGQFKCRVQCMGL